MKNLKLLAITAALGLAMSAQAVNITGSITISGGAVLDNVVLDNATQVTAWNNPVVQSRDGDFSIVAVNTPVAMFAPYDFSSGPVVGLWSVGGFQFDLGSSYVDYQQNGILAVIGTGTISGNLFDSTAGTWRFTTQESDANGVFSFSAATTAVPDGGTTAMLLGGALSALAFIRRKF